MSSDGLVLGERHWWQHSQFAQYQAVQAPENVLTAWQQAGKFQARDQAIRFRGSSCAEHVMSSDGLALGKRYWWQQSQLAQHLAVQALENVLTAWQQAGKFQARDQALWYGIGSPLCLSCVLSCALRMLGLA